MTEQQIQEIKSDMNYFVNQLISEIEMLRQENDYLKGQNEILKDKLKGANNNDSK